MPSYKVGDFSDDDSSSLYIIEGRINASPRRLQDRESLYMDEYRESNSPAGSTQGPLSVFIDETRLSSLMKANETTEIINLYSEGEITQDDYKRISSHNIRRSPLSPLSPTSQSMRQDISTKFMIKSLRQGSNENFKRGSRETLQSMEFDDRNQKNFRLGRRSSTGTVSTTMLLNFNNSGSSGTHSSSSNNDTSLVSAKSQQSSAGRRTSSYYIQTGGDEENSGKSLVSLGIKYPKLNACSPRQFRPDSRASTNSSFRFEDSIEPDIEEAVQMLRREMGVPTPDTDVPPEMDGSRFHLNDYKIIKRVATRSSSENNLDTLQNDEKNTNRASNSRISQNPSLLNNKLIQTDSQNELRYGKGTKTIPVLRNFPHSNKWNATPPVIFSNFEDESNQDTTEENNNNDAQNVVKNLAIQEPEKAKIGYVPDSFTDSQADLTIYAIHQYRKQLHLESYTAMEKPLRNQDMRIQHLDSDSVKSFDSQVNRFHDVYSISRILLLLLCCIILPPLFFMIGIGNKGGISNYKLMRMVMNSHHRIGLLKGFIWDIDITWLRKLCLALGIIELLIIAALIGVGFGVGLHNHT